MAVDVSTTAILVMWDMMSMLAKLTTCPRHLEKKIRPEKWAISKYTYGS
jgi:hypothetical protein